MPESFPTTILWLVTGLAVGTGGGYFWGVDSQLITDPTQQHSMTGVVHNYQQPSADGATNTSAVIPNPTGLRLVGTLVQPERNKSKAWLLQVNSETTQTYAEGDALPGGYRLTTIGAEDLQVVKDGQTFVIRRVSSSSGQNAHLPCEAIAQNAQQVPSPNKLGYPKPAERSSGSTSGGRLIGRNRHSANNETSAQGTGTQSAAQASTQAPAQAAEKSHKPFKGWGNKTTVEGDEVITDRDSSLGSPTDNNNEQDTAH